MIGVVCPEEDLPVAAELFELFKTPWAPFEPDRHFDVLLAEGAAPESDAPLVIAFAAAGGRTAGRTMLTEFGPVPILGGLSPTSSGVPICWSELGEVVATRSVEGNATTIRCGYTLLGEVRRLLNGGQPSEHAEVPTLDLHIALLRTWILAAGISFVDVPPRPPGSSFVACLTHDIDFLRLRDHRFDHTLAGFLYRATVGSVREGLRRRRRWSEVGRNVATAAATPLIQLGLVRDPWKPFESYLDADSPHRSTFFVVPFAGRPGKAVAAPNAGRRAVRYQLEDASRSIRAAAEQGCEIALHGIDAWIDPEAAELERQRIATVTGVLPEGVRMHWLCQDEKTPERLDEAGFSYDASVGYNDAVGFRAGTLQAFRPLGCSHLLELPLHLQDTSLFYRGRLSLSPREAWTRAESLLEHARIQGGVLTVSWHDRSLAPERLWGDFYLRLLGTLLGRGASFLTAGQAVELFRSRRALRFERDPSGARVRVSGGGVAAGLPVRLNRPDGRSETVCTGELVVELPSREPLRLER